MSHKSTEQIENSDIGSSSASVKIYVSISTCSPAICRAMKNIFFVQRCERSDISASNWRLPQTKNNIRKRILLASTSSTSFFGNCSILQLKLAISIHAVIALHQRKWMKWAACSAAGWLPSRGRIPDMLPISGGNWNNGAAAGVFALNINNSSGNTNNNNGCRAQRLWLISPRTETQGFQTCRAKGREFVLGLWSSNKRRKAIPVGTARPSRHAP